MRFYQLVRAIRLEVGYALLQLEESREEFAARVKGDEDRWLVEAIGYNLRTRR